MHAVIFGAAGMLGRAVCAAAPHGVTVSALDIEDVDITDRSQVAAALDREHPALVINAAAYTAVDRAESDRENAEAVNALGPRHVAEEAAQRRIHVVHFSTDYVFSGAASTPRRESEPVAPVNAYGETKLHGERFVLSSHAHALVIRTQWLFGPDGTSFPLTMWRRASARMPTRVVADQHGRPTYTCDLAVATWQLVAQRAHGIVHVTNGGAPATWYDFAREVFVRAGAESVLSACTSAEYPTAARRPAYSVLSTDLFERLASPLPDWRDALDRFLDGLTNPPRHAPDR